MKPQGSVDWHIDKIGKLSGSRASDLLGTPNARKTLLAELAAEIVTGEVHTFSSKPTDHGNKYEDDARALYCQRTNTIVVVPEFIVHQEYPFCGCSLDGVIHTASPSGLVGGVFGIEIKCPFNSIKHVKTILNGMDRKEHYPQVQWNIWCADLKWIDFVSYDPRFPESSRIYIERILRDDRYIDETIIPAVEAFLPELEEVVQRLIGEAA